VYTGQNAKQVDAYLDGVIEEAKLVTQMGGWANRDPHFLYFGGGTPSFLSARQFDRLYNALSKTLSFTSLREFTFECEPGTISLDKVKALHSAGVDRISLGVEHFDDAILALNGRAHDQASIYDAYRYARDAKVPQINIDLIAGLLGDREQTWLDAVNRTIELAPDSVTIYQMELPYNTSFQDDIRRAEQSAAEFVTWPVKRHWVDQAFALLEDAGYQTSSGYTMVNDPKKTSFVYRDALWRGADMMGLGVSAFSHFGGHHYQNEKDIGAYKERISQGLAPIRRGYITTNEERMIREWILQLKTGRVSNSYFLQKFQIDVKDRFRTELDELQRDGLCFVADDSVVLTRLGLLQVDRLLSRFFLRHHRM